MQASQAVPFSEVVHNHLLRGGQVARAAGCCQGPMQAGVLKGARSRGLQQALTFRLGPPQRSTRHARLLWDARTHTHTHTHTLARAAAITHSKHQGCLAGTHTHTNTHTASSAAACLRRERLCLLAVGMWRAQRARHACLQTRGPRTEGRRGWRGWRESGGLPWTPASAAQPLRRPASVTEEAMAGGSGGSAGTWGRVMATVVVPSAMASSSKKGGA